MDRTEKRFESDIEEFLITQGGYIKSSQVTYDKTKAIDMLLLRTFIENTQEKAWGRYAKIYGAEAEKQLYKRFSEEVNTKGLIHVLRNGIKDRGVEIRFCYFKPSSNLNPELVDKYESNILTCTRQFFYSTKNQNSVDMVLSLNGIPIVAMELKNQLTGQNVENAKLQFMKDRDEKELIFSFNKRILVYFCVDLFEVWMTTRLNGQKTFFLPFNQGSHGAGEVGDGGNPSSGTGYATEYLWEEVLQKDSLMSILANYINVQVEEKTEIINKHRVVKKGEPRIIFPRYHQLDVVEKLVGDIKDNGAGKNYLIQHSAGSGKSNSIGWLAYKLSTLHNKQDEFFFKSVFVVTDRRVLNKQLQNTIKGFDHKSGHIVTITDKDNSSALKQAIEDGKKIIITTLHRFPIIYKEVGAQAGNGFAIIVDEAHSSQTGNSAKKLKAALADTDVSIKEYADVLGISEEDVDSYDEIVGELLSQGKHNNLSFFAFTATPKPKTLEMFGQEQSDGTFKAYHNYSMRQAISEGFILDVLRNYNTMENTWNISKNTSGNPIYEETPAMTAIRKYQKNHEYVIEQKVSIIVEQFRQITLSKLEGKAKAMVVCASRAHAVQYFLKIKEYAKLHGYADVKPMVAFSGDVLLDGKKYTEPELNSTEDLKISESQLPDYFASDAYNILIVADKYQTGFDEPKLHSMFVDKGLSGVKAVQTLSRLNRTCKGKSDTYILDFENTEVDIQKSFQSFYEDTELKAGVDVNLVYSFHDKLAEFAFWSEEEIQDFMDVYNAGKPQSSKDLGKITSIIKPIDALYLELDEERKKEFRDALKNFIRFYAYVTQVVRMFDVDLHREYLFCEYLSRLLTREQNKAIDLSDKITLINSQLTETFSGAIPLAHNAEERLFEPEKPKSGRTVTSKTDLLENIIAKINATYGLQASGGEKVVIETIVDKLYNNSAKMIRHAKNSDEEMFAKSIFPDEFNKVAQDCYVEQIDGFTKLFENKDYYEKVMSEMAKVMYFCFRDIK